MVVRPLVALVAVLAVVPAAAIAAPPASSTASCTIVAEGPFLYVDTVIPNSAVQCDVPRRRLHIETQLIRDGAVVTSASRTCRNASVCWLTVDASAPDARGDQVWCVTAKGYAGSTFVGEASSCENESF